MAEVNNFTVLESVYGKLIVNRHCAYQADYLVKTGRTHIEAELRNILAIVAQLPDKPVVVDAGANIGLVSVPVAQAIKDRGGVVHSFEVQRMLFYALCGTAALNDLENLFVMNMALGAEPGQLCVPAIDYAKDQDFGLCSLTGQREGMAGEPVKVTTIDSLALNRLDFLKIDVEGMEIEVLKGAEATIAAHRPWCWIEYWKVEVEEIKRRFDGLGYGFHRMDKLNMLCVPEDKAQAAGISVRAPVI